MGGMFQILGATCGFVSLFCYAFVVYKMFTEGDTVMGIVCGAGFFVCGIGVLIAFVYGWMKARMWEIQPIMMAWTGFWLAGFFLNILAAIFGAETA